MLVELMKKDPDFGDMAGLAEPMLKAFPEIIESTTKVDLVFIQIDLIFLGDIRHAFFIADNVNKPAGCHTNQPN